MKSDTTFGKGPQALAHLLRVGIEGHAAGPSTPDEAKACLGYLHRQIELVQPAVIVTLGATPLRELVGVSEGITKVRGQWRRVTVGGREIPVMPTFHPAYVLRQYTQDVRRAVWADLQAAKAWIDRPE